MLKRAWNQGITASFVLFDSWYAHDALIAESLEIGYGVICRLKANRVKYSSQGRQYTLKQLWQTVAKKKAKSIHGFPYEGICLKATLPKSGDVGILFVSDAKKQWHAFLSTDTELGPSEILIYYARRWAIELFLKMENRCSISAKNRAKPLMPSSPPTAW